MRRLLVFLGIIALVLVAGCAQQSTESQTSSEADEAQPADSQTQVADPKVKTFDPIPGAENLAAVITTDKGEIVFEFRSDKAPSTVANFITLAKQGFYDGTTFHRVTDLDPGKGLEIIQGGDPNTKTGEGPPGTGDPGYKIKAEFNDLKHVEGTVAMARSEEIDSAGSQFYICEAAIPFLDNQYTIFGKVIKGMDVVKKIQQNDVMRSVKIVDKSEVKQ